jgi:hypothetical protein
VLKQKMIVIIVARIDHAPSRPLPRRNIEEKSG